MSSYLAALFFMLTVSSAAQTISQKLTAAFDHFEKDAQLQHAVASLYVADADGTVVFQRNADIGLAPASTQKIITSATAYELLGKTFRYKTDFGVIKSPGSAKGSLYVRGSGDPTLGSWRWEHTKEDALIGRIKDASKRIAFDTAVFIFTTGWNNETIPAGWIWEDIGNYYGAGAGVLNWRENQYDVFLRSGTAVGTPVVITGTAPKLSGYSLLSKVVSAAKESGDNAYIYFPVSGAAGVVRGTIPVGENHFVISGALPDPARQFAATFLQQTNEKASTSMKLVFLDSVAKNATLFYTEVSPPLDSVVFWLNKKSINLYAEALLKTIAYQKTGVGSTAAGMTLLKSFWNEKGIGKTALNLVDGSGLSPLNRITTQAQVAVLLYAKKQSWFPGFYNSLPEYNNMKLKSGTISGVKGFAGYYTSRSGITYTLSFLVNNYNGTSAGLVKKMYAVLDVLK